EHAVVGDGTRLRDALRRVRVKRVVVRGIAGEVGRIREDILAAVGTSPCEGIGARAGGGSSDRLRLGAGDIDVLDDAGLRGSTFHRIIAAFGKPAGAGVGEGFRRG